MNRREFLKNILLLSSSLALIKNFDFELFKEDISEFSPEQLENILKIKDIKIITNDNPYVYFPEPEYTIIFKDGTREFYHSKTKDKMEEKYGSIIKYYNEGAVNLDNITIDKDGWLL